MLQLHREIRGGGCRDPLERYCPEGEHMERIILTIVLVGFGAACVPHTFVTKKETNPAMPKTFSAKNSNSLAKKLDSQWWKEFKDSDLDSTIEQGLKSNLDIQMAAARFEQADAAAEKLAPSIGLGLIYGWTLVEIKLSISFWWWRTRVQPLRSFGGCFVRGRPLGEISLTEKGALLDVKASHEDVNAAIMSITAGISETWYLLAEQRAQAVLLRKQISVNETVLSLIQTRFEQGLANALDVFQQKQQLLRTRRRLEPTLAQIRVLENQLDVLLGRAPTADRKEKQIQLPRLDGLPKMGLPLDLLQQRPDLRAAHARVQAADHRIASAIADRFPTLRLSASTGFLSGDLSTIFDGLIWNVLGGLVLPLIDGGQRRAEVSRQQAILKMTLAQYKKVVITAVQEVEDALVRLQGKNQNSSNFKQN